jgi:hypothetical protein
MKTKSLKRKRGGSRRGRKRGEVIRMREMEREKEEGRT